MRQPEPGCSPPAHACGLSATIRGQRPEILPERHPPVKLLSSVVCATPGG